MSEIENQLPADIDTLHALMVAACAERDAAIAERETAIGERDRALSQIDRLRHLLRQLQRAHFGKRSEKLDPTSCSERHDMSSQHLFSWIRAAKEGRLALPADEVAVFVPIVTAATEVTKAPKAAPLTPIEIGIKDFVVRAGPGIDMRLLFDVLRAVKAAA